MMVMGGFSPSGPMPCLGICQDQQLGHCVADNPKQGLKTKIHNRIGNCRHNSDAQNRHRYPRPPKLPLLHGNPNQHQHTGDGNDRCHTGVLHENHHKIIQRNKAGRHQNRGSDLEPQTVRYAVITFFTPMLWPISSLSFLHSLSQYIIITHCTNNCNGKKRRNSAIPSLQFMKKHKRLGTSKN